MPIIRSSIKSFLYSAFLVYATALFFFNYPINSFLPKLFQIGITIIIVFDALLIGKKIMRFLSVYDEDIFSEYIYPVGIGFGFLSITIFFCGAVGLLQKPVMFLLLSMPVLIERKQVFLLCLKIKKINVRIDTITSLIIIFIIGASVFLCFIASLAPPLYYDSLVYHLALPAQYLRDGIIRTKSYNIFSYFPENMEMLFTFSLGTGGELSAKLISCACMIVTLCALYNFLKKITSIAFARLGCLIYATSPSVILLGSGAYVEMGMSMYLTLCVISFYSWCQSDKKGYLILSAIFGGLTFGTKYTGIICPGILFILLFIKPYIFKNSKTNVLSAAVMYGGISASVSSIWLIRNIVSIQNPVFPFFYNVFGWGSLSWSKATAAGYFNNFTEYAIKKNIIVDLINVMFNASQSAIAYGGGFDVLGDFGWALPFLLLLTLFFGAYKKKHVQLLGLYMILYLVVWASTGQVLRFLFPVFPILIILSIAGLEEFLKQNIILIKTIMYGIITVFIISNFYLFFTIVSVMEPWHVALGIEQREAFLKRKYPDYYPAMQYINTKLSEDSKIYLYGDQRGFYCKIDYEATCAFAPERLVGWANSSHSVDEFIAKLIRRNFTHIFVNIYEAQRLKPYGVADFNNQGLKIWHSALNNKFKKIYQNKYGAVFQIKK